MRSEIRFAVLPVRLDDGTWLWLRSYTLTEQLDPDLETEWGQVWVVVRRHRPSAESCG